MTPDQTNEFKSHFSMVMIFIVILGIACGTTGFFAYKIGKSNGKLVGALQAIKESPPNIYNCQVAKVDQSTKKEGSGLAITVRKMHIGLWWDPQ